MVSQTGPIVARSNSCKGEVYPGKGPKKGQRAKRKFWGQQVLFGTKILKFGPKRPTKQPWLEVNTRFAAMILLHNKDQQQKNPLPSSATLSAHEWTARSLRHSTRTM